MKSKAFFPIVLLSLFAACAPEQALMDPALFKADVDGKHVELKPGVVTEL